MSASDDNWTSSALTLSQTQALVSLLSAELFGATIIESDIVLGAQLDLRLRQQLANSAAEAWTEAFIEASCSLCEWMISSSDTSVVKWRKGMLEIPKHAARDLVGQRLERIQLSVDGDLDWSWSNRHHLRFNAPTLGSSGWWTILRRGAWAIGPSEEAGSITYSIEVRDRNLEQFGLVAP